MNSLISDPTDTTAVVISELVARLRKLERALRVTWGLVACAAVAAFVLSPQSASIAQTIGVTLTSLNTRLTAVEAKTASMSSVVDPNTNVQTVRFTAVNLQVVNGSGNTDTQNNNSLSSGNLIIGYNELGNINGDARSGTHNLIVGSLNSYSGSSGVVFGYGNLISAPYADITGGADNIANGLRASVTGGAYNQASNQEASVSGGVFNTANSPRASVSGGSYNNASAYTATVSGGNFVAQGAVSGWSGGTYHTP